MKNRLKYGIVIMAALTSTGCSSGNFMVYKNSKHFYVTSNGPELRRILCDSGDMDKITKDKTTIVDGAGKKQKIEARIRQIRAQIE